MEKHTPIVKKYRLDANVFSNEKDSDATVCIVGKHPSLKGRGLGRLIDSHDIVVRINPWYSMYGDMCPEDKGKKTNHISSNPYHIFRDSLKAYRIKNVERALFEMSDFGNNKKTLYVPIADESWFRYRNNGPLIGHVHGDFSVTQKLKNYEKALTLCQKFDVILKLRKITNLANSINDMMVYFNHHPGNSHGLLSGTETVLYYMEHFKNVSVAGFSWSIEEYEKLVIRPTDGWANQYQYDCFFLNEALNRGLISKLD